MIFEQKALNRWEGVFKGESGTEYLATIFSDNTKNFVCRITCIVNNTERTVFLSKRDGKITPNAIQQCIEDFLGYEIKNIQFKN